MRPFGLRSLVPGFVLLPAAFCLIAPKAFAIPAFSRQYQTSCSTCHLDFPKLNDFGKAFKDAGFKFPADDETYVKNPPVLLGATASKDQFPKTHLARRDPRHAPHRTAQQPVLSIHRIESEPVQFAGNRWHRPRIDSRDGFRGRVLQHFYRGQLRKRHRVLGG